MSPTYYTTPTACSCKDWQYRGRDRPCKHVRRLREAVETIKGQRDHNAALQAAQGAQRREDSFKSSAGRLEKAGLRGARDT